MGFSENLGWEMGIGSPLQSPLSDVENRETFARIEKTNISATIFLSLPKNLAKNQLVPLLYELYVYLHNYSRSCLIQVGFYLTNVIKRLF